jgi:predicted  nucleic acid-binding Zn-ribbon protein
MIEGYAGSQVELLVAYQNILLAIREHESAMAEIPERIEAVEKNVLQKRELQEKETKQLEETLKARRQLELDLKEIEQRISKYQEQRWAVKSNRECAAIINEIELARKEASALEEKILLNMEACDEIEKEIESRKADVEMEKAAFEKEKAVHLGELTKLKAAIEALKREKADTEKLLTPDSLALFRKTAKVRGGVAIALVKDGYCQECHIALRLQYLAEVKSNDRLMLCENCSRILYYREERPPKPEAEAETPFPPLPTPEE